MPRRNRGCCYASPDMKGRSKKAVFVLCGVAALGLLSWGWLRSREPVYHGRGLSSWLEELGRSWPGQGSEQSTQAIRAMGTNALPYIVDAIKARDSALKVKLVELLRRQNLIRFQFRMADEKQDSAYKALLVLGPGAKSAIPQIGRLLGETDLGWNATTALFAIGKESIPQLVAACGHTNPSVRAEAAFVLSKLMPGGGGYTTTYFPAGSTNAVSRFALTLGDNDIAALGVNLSDPRPAVRRASAEALGRHSGIAKPATPALVKALEDPDKEVSKAAADALQAINPAEAKKAGAQ